MSNYVRKRGNSTPRIVATASPADISITPQLMARSARARSDSVESEGVRQLADAIAAAPADAPGIAVAVARAATGAASCGIYLLESGERGERDENVRLLSVTGGPARRFPDVIARYLSPCAASLQSGQTELLQRPDRVYPYIGVGSAIDEMLLVPLRCPGDRVQGVLWVTSHGPDPAFDGGDARFLELVATFVTIALDAEKAAAAAQARSAEHAREVEELTRTNLDLARDAEVERASAATHALAFTELEHRVKNTLLMASTVLRWESARTEDPHAVRALEGARRRILAVGEMDRLAARTDVDVSATIGELCAAIAGGDPRISVRFSAAELRAPGPAAAIVGLIVNELLTNAIKHAAPGPEAVVTIGVSLSREGPEHAVLAVTDDGAPFAPVPGGTKGLGLNLVKGLARQLGGSLDINGANKSFVVKFPTGRHAYTGVAAPPMAKGDSGRA